MARGHLAFHGSIHWGRLSSTLAPRSWGASPSRDYDKIFNGNQASTSTAAWKSALHFTGATLSVAEILLRQAVSPEELGLMIDLQPREFLPLGAEGITGER